MDEQIRIEANKLRELLRTYQHAYYVDSRPLVSDMEYDTLFDRLSFLEETYPELYDENSPTVRVGSDLSADFPEFEHTIPVLSLDKAYSTEAILGWIEKAQKKGEKRLSFVIEEKIDGLSMVLYYEQGRLVRAVTRGNGAVGNEVTANIKTIKAVPLVLMEPVDIVVRGEVYLPKADFESINSKLEEPYANPRNLAAGTVRRQKSSEAALVPLTIFCYEGFTDSVTFTDHIEILSYLKKLGFRINPNLGYFCSNKEEALMKIQKANIDAVAGSFEDIPSYIQSKTETRGSLAYEIDGLVSKVNELDVREDFGYTEHHPRWAIAYKFEAPQAQTVLKDITLQVGRTGRVTPVAELEPVKLNGSTIKRTTLHNVDYINELELAIGDTVAISKRGDVIPAVEAVIEKNTEGNTTYHLPLVCPTCKTPLVQIGAHHFCPNYDCPDQVLGRMSFFVGKDQMDIVGFGPETVKYLFDNCNVKSIEELYDFDFTTLENHKGFKEKTIENLINGMRATRETPFRNILVSLGIPEFGKKAIDNLCDNGLDTMDKLLEVAKNQDLGRLLSIPQIGERSAKLLIDSLNGEHMLHLINKLREEGLKMEDEKKQNNQAQIFAGQSWCITGSFESFASRDLISDMIAQRGGNVVSAVSKKTTVLLAGNKAGSKLAKATALGIKIMNEEEFLTLLEGSEESEGSEGSVEVKEGLEVEFEVKIVQAEKPSVYKQESLFDEE